MPSCMLPGWAGEVKRNSLLLDTNVLFAGFYQGDRNHDEARLFLEECQYEIFVPVAVLVEAWGLIVGSRRRFDLGIEMMKWVNTPGRATVLPQPIDDFVDVQSLLEGTRVDCVDAILYNLAVRMERELQAVPLVRVATYDASDFYRCMKTTGVNIKIFDMREEVGGDL